MIRYKNDPWLWDLDWSTQSLRFLKTAKKKPKVPVEEIPEEEVKNPIFRIAGDRWLVQTASENHPELTPSPAVQKVLDTHQTLSKVRPHMPGYPR